MGVLSELYTRNTPLFMFGAICGVGAFTCLILIKSTEVQVLGINAWIKPFKFYLSTIIFVWTMAWYLAYLKQTPILTAYTWVVILVLAFELLYISWQAGKGELSHFNVSSRFHSTMFSMMGLAISLMTIFTLYIAILFFTEPLPDLPSAYLWGIRLGLICFVIFAFEGGIMGAKLAHTVGGPDGELGIKWLNWSLTKGDLRIAHFIGMHALQVLPIIGFYLITDTKYLIGFSMLYFGLTTSVMVQAFMGLPLIKK